VRRRSAVRLTIRERDGKPLVRIWWNRKLPTLADIVKSTEAKPRTVQLWADAGVIVPDPGSDREGSGRHRQFSKREVVIACIVARFAAEKVAIGGLKAIALELRRNAEFLSGEQWALNEAFLGKGRNFVQITSFTNLWTGQTSYNVRLINSARSSMPLIQFLEEGASGSSKLSVIDLDHALRHLRQMEA
jgi:hypothetical protein